MFVLRGVCLWMVTESSQPLFSHVGKMYYRSTGLVGHVLVFFD